MTTLLALDPGGTTGYSLWEYTAITPLTLIHKGQISGGLDGFIAWSAGMHPEEVVAETFRLDGRTVKPDVTPLRIEGALSVIWPHWIGQPNTMKVHADDVFMKRAGLSFRGMPHATDSARHALALMKVRRHVPTIKRYWPDRKEEQ
ncbi:MAG: hypothetical protein BGN98_13870 [Microbacterium sp. 69-7]|uniref:hypothetical protein n=1 Tax=Microbacterium sp. 69-7 TaxID=1895784 RepID=UPI0009648A9E|nr:hypothetical protein [Microbacterium sp. 69-7]OJU44467.1 MAG: hypothetical protein BGN98_13870 [Microbacterium sp. 69-7]